MAYIFRTAGPWGAGQSIDLTPAEVDGNFWQAIQDITAKSAQGVGISNVIQSGNQYSFVLTDHTVIGPLTLPVVLPIFRGEWAPDTPYLAGDIFTHAGSTYGVLVNHTSAATFDPGANDGFGHDFYQLLLSDPALVVPAGGAAGTFLRKVTGVDYVFAWETADLNDLSDVVITAPTANEVLTYSSGVWTNAVAPQHSLAGLSDVLQSPAPVSGDIVYWNGSAFAYLDQATVLDSLPLVNVGSVSGSFSLNLSLSEAARITLTGSATITGFTWPSGSSGRLIRRVVEVFNTGSFTLTWPSASKWPGGTKPTLTTGAATDIYILFTSDGGTTVYGNVVGQSYS